MVPEKTQDFRGVSLKRELVEQIEEFIKEFPQYKSKADFVHEAVRLRIEDVKKVYALKLPPVLEHFNLDEDGVKIHDTTIREYVRVAFKPKGIWCDYCQTSDCRHIRFALSVPAIQKVIRKRIKDGWNLPDV